MPYHDFSTTRITRKLLTRLFDSIKISTEHFYNGDPCWEWTKSRYTDTGYAQASLANKHGHFNISGHKLFYQLFVGFIPQNLVIDHLCRVHHCVNPVHLDLVTHKENTARGIWTVRRGHAPRDVCTNGHKMEGRNIRYGKHKANKSSGMRRYCRECRNNQARKDYQTKKQRLNST